MITITITEAELGLLREGLDSYEYWEHRDELPHDSGFITILDDADFASQLGEGTEEAREAWANVKAARELDSKLAALVTS